jgi:hypothetical protein
MFNPIATVVTVESTLLSTIPAVTVESALPISIPAVTVESALPSSIPAGTVGSALLVSIPAVVAVKSTFLDSIPTVVAVEPVADVPSGVLDTAVGDRISGGVIQAARSRSGRTQSASIKVIAGTYSIIRITSHVVGHTATWSDAVGRAAAW